jgi:hypothetical protein
VQELLAGGFGLKILYVQVFQRAIMLKFQHPGISASRHTDISRNIFKETGEKNESGTSAGKNIESRDALSGCRE